MSEEAAQKRYDEAADFYERDDVKEAQAEIIAYVNEQKQRLGENNYSQSKLAKELGQSSATVSNFLKGAYSSPHKFLEKWKQFKRIAEARRALPDTPGYAETSISEIVYGRIRHALEVKKQTMAYGDAAVGKTMAVRKFAEDYPEAAVVITANPVFYTVTGLYTRLADALHIGGKNACEIYNAVVRILKHSNKVIIFDEAQLLTLKQIEAMRSLGDECEIGLAFVGNDAIYTKMRELNQRAYDQLQSRFCDGDSDVDALRRTQIKIGDVEKVFASYGLDEESLALLHKVARGTPYGMRGPEYIHMNAAKKSGGAAKKEDIKYFAMKKLSNLVICQ